MSLRALRNRHQDRDVLGKTRVKDKGMEQNLRRQNGYGICERGKGKELNTRNLRPQLSALKKKKSLTAVEESWSQIYPLKESCRWRKWPSSSVAPLPQASSMYRSKLTRESTAWCEHWGLFKKVASRSCQSAVLPETGSVESQGEQCTYTVATEYHSATL